MSPDPTHTREDGGATLSGLSREGILFMVDAFSLFFGNLHLVPMPVWVTGGWVGDLQERNCLYLLIVALKDFLAHRSMTQTHWVASLLKKFPMTELLTIHPNVTKSQYTL